VGYIKRDFVLADLHTESTFFGPAFTPDFWRLSTLILPEHTRHVRFWKKENDMDYYHRIGRRIDDGRLGVSAGLDWLRHLLLEIGRDMCLGMFRRLLPRLTRLLWLRQGRRLILRLRLRQGRRLILRLRLRQGRRLILRL
jgi:hypothetical protein